MFCLLFVVSECITSCKKEPTCKGKCEECVNLSTAYVRSFKNLPDYQEYPCFNPMNPNEFIFLRRLNKETQLEKYDLILKKTTVLLKGVSIAGPPKWNKNGWIVFSTLPELQLYLIKDDGSNLHILNKNFVGLTDHTWKNENIIAAQWSAKGTPTYYTEFNIDGTLLDTLKGIGSEIGVYNSEEEYLFTQWRSDPDIYFKNKDTTYSLLSEQILKPSEFRLSTGSIVWHPNNEDFFFSKLALGIFKSNIREKKEVRIRVGCGSRQYKIISLSLDGKKMLVDKLIQFEVDDSGVMPIETNIYMIDLDTGQEEKIVL